jgi:hypothetical protein
MVLLFSDFNTGMIKVILITSNTSTNQKILVTKKEGEGVIP